jgi:hypothetical protein
MQSQLRTSAERERPKLFAATCASLPGEITALERVREVEEESAAPIRESRPGVERRRGVGQSVDGNKGQQVRMAKGPEGLAAEWDPRLGTGTDQRPTLPRDHRTKAPQRDGALEHEPWEWRDLCDCADLRDIPIDATASLHGGEVSGFAG